MHYNRYYNMMDDVTVTKSEFVNYLPIIGVIVRYTFQLCILSIVGTGSESGYRYNESDLPP